MSDDRHDHPTMPPGASAMTALAVFAEQMRQVVEVQREQAQQMRFLQTAVDKMPQTVGDMIEKKLGDALKDVVTDARFRPVEKIVNGLVSVLLLAILGMIIGIASMRAGVLP